MEAEERGPCSTCPGFFREAANGCSLKELKKQKLTNVHIIFPQVVFISGSTALSLADRRSSWTLGPVSASCRSLWPESSNHHSLTEQPWSSQESNPPRRLAWIKHHEEEIGGAEEVRGGPRRCNVNRGANPLGGPCQRCCSWRRGRRPSGTASIALGPSAPAHPQVSKGGRRGHGGAEMKKATRTQPDSRKTQV